VSGPRKLGSLLSSWNADGRGKGFGAKTDESAAALAVAWEQAVGPAIARRSRPTRLNAGVLTVLTASSAWSHELTYLAPAIVETLRGAVPEAHLRRLRFMVATGRTKLLLEGERFRNASKLPRRARNVHASDTKLTRMREEEDVTSLVTRLASEQRSLNDWRDRSGWQRCPTCGARFWASSSQTSCAPCASARRRNEDSRVELALMQAPWVGASELRQSLPNLRAAVYRRARQRLLTRWQLEIAAAERRLRRSTLTPQDRVTAWSYLMLLTGIPERDIGRAVVRDVLGLAWVNALFACGRDAQEEAHMRSREKHL
jgi:predicted nucleic acid-binding Zn ribbon protein